MFLYISIQRFDGGR